MLDERLVRALHVQSLREEELHAEREPHVLFQASTIGALLDGAYEGDVTFAELAEHGDLGLGTLNSLDGEMIAVDGSFYRADVEGAINEVDPQRRTPFAVLTWFTPTAWGEALFMPPVGGWFLKSAMAWEKVGAGLRHVYEVRWSICSARKFAKEFSNSLAN